MPWTVAICFFDGWPYLLDEILLGGIILCHLLQPFRSRLHDETSLDTLVPSYHGPRTSGWCSDLSLEGNRISLLAIKQDDEVTRSSRPSRCIHRSGRSGCGLNRSRVSYASRSRKSANTCCASRCSDDLCTTSSYKSSMRCRISACIPGWKRTYRHVSYDGCRRWSMLCTWVKAPHSLNPMPEKIRIPVAVACSPALWLRAPPR